MTLHSRICFAKHTEYMTSTPSEGLSVGQSSSSMSERTVRLVGERTGRLVGPIGQEINVANAQIRTLLDRQKEQILADCQAEINRHDFQAKYDRRRVRKLGEIFESQQEELHCSKIRNHVKLSLTVKQRFKNTSSRPIMTSKVK